ncbi:hypothetical protein JOM56_000349 [Amanita muscaria]
MVITATAGHLLLVGLRVLSPPRFPEPGYADKQFVGQDGVEEKSIGPQQQFSPPPAHSADPQSVSQSIPPTGFRISLNTTSNFFPPLSQLGAPPCFDRDNSPLYFGSVHFSRSVHPCKVGAHLKTYALVPYGGKEQTHSGSYDLLPFSPKTMELVRTSRAQVPPGRRPVEGGYEENGNKLYHAVAVVKGFRMPAKTGLHLRGANVGYGGKEVIVTTDYEILCWR